jgi:hypothetical protein
MATYTIETPRGHQVTLEADSPETAIQGAQTWDMQDYASSEAKTAGLNPDLVLRTMHQESGSNPDAQSPAGAQGPMQLMPATAKALGVDPSDPYQNITGGVRYLKQMKDQFGRDDLALAAYNAGPGAVQKYGGVPPYPETQHYVSAILGSMPPPAAAAPAPNTGDGSVVNAKTGGALNAAQTAAVRADKYDLNAPIGSEFHALAQVDPSVTPPAGIWYYDLNGKKQLSGSSPGEDQGSFWGNFGHPVAEAWRGLVHDIGQSWDENQARLKAGAPDPVTAALRGVKDLGTSAKIAADVLGLAGQAFGGDLLNAAVVQPGANLLDKIPLPMYAPPPAPWEPGFGKAPVPLTSAQAHDAHAQMINTALMGLPAENPMFAQNLPRAPVADAATRKVGAVIEQAIKRDQTSPENIIAAARANPTLPPFQAGGQNLASLADILAQSPGDGAQIITNAIRDHQAGAADRIKAQIADGLGGQNDYFATHDAMQAQRAAAAKPLLDTAFAQPIDGDVFQQQITPILARLPKGAMGHAYDLARKAGENPEELGLVNADTFDGYNTPPPAPAASIVPGDLRAVKRGVSPATPQGPSLLQFISKSGGINDVGGELGNMDAQIWHTEEPFRRPLVSDNGLSAEEMAQRAQDAGYFPDAKVPTMDSGDNMHAVTADDLHAAVEAELAGRPRFAQEPDMAAVARKARVEGLSDQLRQGGIDPNKATPQQIAEALGKYQDDVARNEAFASASGPGMSPNEPMNVAQPTMKTLHYIKKGIDQSLEQYRNPVTRQLDLSGSPGAQVDTQVRKTLGQTMRAINPDYDKAMQMWGDDSDRVNALELGRNVFSPKFDMQSENLGQLHSEMSAAAKDDFRKGVGEAVLGAVRSKGGVQEARQLLKSQELGDRVKLAFPKQKDFENFMASMRQEVNYQDRNNRVLGGSPTYARAAARADLEAQPAQAIDAVPHAVDAILFPKRIPGNLLRAGIKAIPKKDMSVIGDPMQNAALARALTDSVEMRRLLNLMQTSRATKSGSSIHNALAVLRPLVPAQAALTSKSKP